jgi:hypothetical protein
MSPFLIALLYLTARYVHVVAATFLVGGTLFYEMVVPMAIDDLRPEQQLVVFARARLIFTWIVWISCAMMLVSGVVASQEHWDFYNPPEQQAQPRFNWGRLPGYWQEWGTSRPTSRPQHMHPQRPPRPLPPEEVFVGHSGLWWAAHASSGLLSLIIAFGLTLGKAPHPSSVRWMRINLAILLLVMFLASATRQARLAEEQHRMTMQQVEGRG